MPGNRGMLKTIIRGLQRVSMCKHEQECMVTYGRMPGIECTMCRECWNKEVHVKVAEDMIQVMYPNRIDATTSMCLGCEKSMSGCVCA